MIKNNFKKGDKKKKAVVEDKKKKGVIIIMLGDDDNSLSSKKWEEKNYEVKKIYGDCLEGLQGLVGKMSGQNIIIPNELICSACQGELRVEKAIEAILSLSINNELRLRCNLYCRASAVGVMEKLEEAGVVYINNIDEL